MTRVVLRTAPHAYETSVADGVHPDTDEVEFLCLLLDAARIVSPLIDVGWLEAWHERLISAADVMDAASELETGEND